MTPRQPQDFTIEGSLGLFAARAASENLIYRYKLLMKKFQAQVFVTLRPSVLDPAGTAVQAGLNHMGYENVEQIRIGKYIELTLTATDESEASQQLDRMCDQLLANPVIENYRFQLSVLNDTAAGISN